MGFIREKKKSSPASSTSPCANLRIAYHNCFNRWYSEKFVKGQWDKEECASEWQKYRACLAEHLDDKHLSRFLEAEGVVDPGSPIDGAATDDSRRPIFIWRSLATFSLGGLQRGQGKWRFLGWTWSGSSIL